MFFIFERQCKFSHFLYNTYSAKVPCKHHSIYDEYMKSSPDFNVYHGYLRQLFYTVHVRLNVARFSDRCAMCNGIAMKQGRDPLAKWRFTIYQLPGVFHQMLPKVKLKPGPEMLEWKSLSIMFSIQTVYGPFRCQGIATFSIQLSCKPGDKFPLHKSISFKDNRQYYEGIPSTP